MREWWATLTERERRLLLVMFALMGIVLGWLLIVRPLGDALDDAQRRHGAAIVALAEAKARAEAAGARPSTATPSLPLDSLIGRTAADAGFANARVAGQGPARATFAIDAARPQAVLGWIARLEGQGVTVDSLRARANPDRTVSVEAAFTARRGR